MSHLGRQALLTSKLSCRLIIPSRNVGASHVYGAPKNRIPLWVSYLNFLFSLLHRRIFYHDTIECIDGNKSHLCQNVNSAACSTISIIKR